MSFNGTPVRRCVPCDRDWPNLSAYNLCPRCLKCTFAHAVLDAPDYPKAREDAARYEKIREFDAKCDAAALKQRGEWDLEMEALLAATSSTAPPATNAQDVTYRDASNA